MVNYVGEVLYDVSNNKKFKNLVGTLSDQDARTTLAEFLFQNLGLTVQILTGGSLRLFPIQELIIKNWFNHPFCYEVASRGLSKSFKGSVFSWLWCIFNPATKIVIASNSFRATRRIIAMIETAANHKAAKMLRACFDLDGNRIKISKRGDEWELKINEGSITALPLNERIRGTRADVLICDEFLQIPEYTYKGVLMPFLSAKSDIAASMKRKEVEDNLISRGAMSEEDRFSLEMTKKIIALTSASYDFEFAYKLYSEWVDNVVSEIKPKDVKKKYFICRLSYKAAPDGLLEKEIIDEAASFGEETTVFQREFMAKFTSSSDGYFNIKKLHACTVKNGDLPCVQLRGSEDAKYLLAIDPNSSDSRSSDLFGMGVYLIDNSSRRITLVHSYGVPGGNLIDHINYFLYILTSFNIVFIIADLTGEGINFIQSANESSLFSKNFIRLKFIEGDFDIEDGYSFECKKGLKSYSILDRTICYRQIFSSDWIRKANEYLKTRIECSKIWFASPLCSHDLMFQRAIKNSDNKPPVEVKDKTEKVLDNMLEFAGWQDYLVTETKSQVALIEPKVSETGNISFNIPLHLRKSKSPDRARRDLYTTLLMAAWGSKIFWDMNDSTAEMGISTFSPMIIKRK